MHQNPTVFPLVLLVQVLSGSQGPGQDVVRGDVVDPVAEAQVPVGVLEVAGDVTAEN